MRLIVVVAAVWVGASCAHAETPRAQAEAPATASGQTAEKARPTLKRKIAVGRFSNSTHYGKALLLDADRDPLADQAADMLTARLVDSGQFLVFERNDIDALKREQAGLAAAKLVGVDTLLVGSVLCGEPDQ